MLGMRFLLEGKVQLVSESPVSQTPATATTVPPATPMLVAVSSTVACRSSCNLCSSQVLWHPSIPWHHAPICRSSRSVPAQDARLHVVRARRARRAPLRRVQRGSTRGSLPRTAGSHRGSRAHRPQHGVVRQGRRVPPHLHHRSGRESSATSTGFRFRPDSAHRHELGQTGDGGESPSRHGSGLHAFDRFRMHRRGLEHLLGVLRESVLKSFRTFLTPRHSKTAERSCKLGAESQTSRSRSCRWVSERSTLSRASDTPSHGLSCFASWPMECLVT